MALELGCIKAQLTLIAVDPISLPAYKGSAIRGGFGHAFRKVVCAVRKKNCDDCLLKHKCAYSYVFETPPPPDTTRMRKYPRAPHPFVIEPPDGDKQMYEPEEKLGFSLVLIGRGREYLSYFIYAFEELGKMGIGRGKGRYRLETVSCGGKIIYTSETRTLHDSGETVTIQEQNGPASRVAIRFLTPTRIKYEEQLSAEPEFHVLIRNLLRRLSSLSYFHEQKELNLDYKGLIERAEAVKTDRKDLTWIDWERYSSRQDTRMKLGGFVGEMEFEGDLAEFMPLLRLGEVVHIGKATSFGLGKFRIDLERPS